MMVWRDAVLVMDGISPELSAANRILQQKRTAQGRAGSRPTAAAPAAPPPDLETLLDGLPDHLGWESATVTAVLRGRQSQKKEPGGEDAPPTAWLTELAEAVPPATAEEPIPTAPDPNGAVRLYPDIALGMLRQEAAAAGRIWLALQYLDGDGRGWMTVAEARERLTRKDSPFRIVGWRQLRNLLREGQGMYWQRDKERIWLRSLARVAVSLGVTRLTGRPVALPITALCRSLGTVKAHLFVSFHSGRRHNTPISRSTLAQMSGVPARTQLAYEKVTGIEKQRNIALGERYGEEEVERRAWRHGRAVFDFIDHQGFQGEAKRHYVAWWLPNSYRGCHEPCGKGRQRKINRRIDLVTKGRGNDPALRPKVFHPNGAEAAKAYDGQQDHFWANDSGPTDSKMVWYTLVGRQSG